LSLVEDFLQDLCLISQAMTQLFFDHKKIIYLAHPINRRFASQSADQPENAKYNEIDGNDIIQ